MRSVKPTLLHLLLLAFFSPCVSHQEETFTAETDALHDAEHEKQDSLTAVIISNRLKGIIPTATSLLQSTTKKKVKLVLISGDDDIDVHARVVQHFSDREITIETMTVRDVQEDLLSQNLNPIWLWDQWHSSVLDSNWASANNSLQVAEWDELDTHAHVLNHLRFYLPHVSTLQDDEHIIFMDDDVLVQKDFSDIITEVGDNVDPSKGLTCACNIWLWNSDCHHFEFKSQYATILETSALYGGRPTCKSSTQKSCVPPNYESFMTSAVPSNRTASDQTAWNFGFCVFHMQNWRREQLTTKYETAMKINYEHRVIPETSLVFGLGLPFLAFTGAVSCWKDNEVSIRDGFGFIEWGRYEKAFGENFFSEIDVVHYTGPKKPWVPYSTIDANAIQPWLAVMEEEGLGIPPQLPTSPSKDIFQVLTSHRSGSEWVMTMLDQHPEICASGEVKKPEVGFPTEAMSPIHGASWLPQCSIKKGCSFQFVRDGVRNLTASENSLGRCCGDLRVQRDFCPIASAFPSEHKQRLCNFAKYLDGNYTDEAILEVWTKAFVDEDQSLLGCACPRGTTVKGLKIMTSWIVERMNGSPAPITNLHRTKFKGSRVIRLKRSNLFDRYKSLVTAQSTNTWHARKKGDKAAGQDLSLVIPVEQMVSNIKFMEEMDNRGDLWAQEHASEVLQVDYDLCRVDQESCRSDMLTFLGVEKAKAQTTNAISKFSNEDGRLAHISNGDEVVEALGANGYGHFVAEAKEYKELELLIYETEDLATLPSTSTLLKRVQRMKGIRTSLIGQGETFKGFGSKFSAAMKALEHISPDALVVLIDSRDVLVNIHTSRRLYGQHANLYSALAKFRSTFANMTKGLEGAVVVSAEAQCCVSALSHFFPGELFDEHGHRTKRTCSSGFGDCLWKSDTKAQAWRDFMVGLQELKSRSVADAEAAPLDDVYLNAGLIVGKAQDLLRLIISLDILEEEDDQAVLTDFMYRNPDAIILDYQQELFGNSRWSSGSDGCVFDLPRDAENLEGQRLVHSGGTGSSPLFIHNPGHFMSCHRSLAKKLAVNPATQDTEFTPSEFEMLEESRQRHLSYKAPKAKKAKKGSESRIIRRRRRRPSERQ